MNLGSIWSNKKSSHVINKLQNSVVSAPPVNISVISVNISAQRSRAYWGTPTWILFHTVAAKTDINFYNANYALVWTFIKNVCHNLPCPYCKKHAMEYVNKISLHEISTKEKLKAVLYKFHNIANGHGGSAHAPVSVLDKYNKTNTKQIFDLFEARFFKSFIGTRQFNDWTKNKFKQEFYAFFNVIRTHIS